MLRGQRFVLVGAESDLAACGPAPGAEWADWVDVHALVDDRGPVMLVRPDGYVAWAADHPTPTEVRSGLAQWCAAPASAWDTSA